MRRRDFITLIGGAAAWPIAARAQPVSIPVLGCLHAGSAGPAARNLAAFQQGLGELGYVEGRNVAIEYRFAEDRLDRLPALAAELARRDVAVLVALGGSDAARAAKNASKTIPVVFNVGNDPVQTGLVASLARPGGNVTGVTQVSREIQGKRLAMARELLPDASVIATFTNPTSTVAELNLSDLRAVSASAGQRLLVLETSNDSELETAFATLVQQGAGALFVANNPFFFNHRDLIVRLAAHNRVPTIFADRQAAEAGGLMSYGTNIADLYRQVGIYAGRILKGTKPADLPVLEPTRFELVINLKTAKALGLTVPPTLRAIADEVIE
jgi:putative ABC transport system substrate-binding protein